MKVKINGTPWEDYPTPKIDNIWEEIVSTHSCGLDTSCTLSVADIFTHQDQINYWVFSHTELTKEVYKAACWTVERVFDFIIGGI